MTTSTTSDRTIVAELCGTASEFGPESITVVHEPRHGWAAIVVVDNTARGVAIGGVRMAVDVSIQEVARLARAMTLKNAAAGLRHGGGKAGIVGDPSMTLTDKEAVMRWFAAAIRDISDYIPGPDMGTDETCMAWVRDEIGRAVGLPAAVGGIPLDEIGATGYGLAIAAEAVRAAGILELHGARVAIQGFGAVGVHTARFLADRGASIVAVSDSRATVSCPAGLALDDVIAWKHAGRHFDAWEQSRPEPAHAVIAADCDIFVPAARPDVIDTTNVADLKARVVLEGANIPITLDAEQALHQRGVLCLPDWIVNAGGVICAAVEYAGGGRTQAFEQIAEKIRDNATEVIERSRSQQMTPRAAATGIAEDRVRAAMALRRAF